MSVSGVICTTPVYKYKGWLFEYHKYFGPWPLKKDFEPRKRAGRVFWGLFSEFNSLNEDEKKKYRIAGGCHFF